MFKHLWHVIGVLGMIAAIAGCSGGGAFQEEAEVGDTTTDVTKTIKLSSSDNVRVELSSSEVLADGQSVARLSVWVKSAGGLPIQDMPVLISLLAEKVVIASPPSGVTDENGVFTTEISSQFVQNNVIVSAVIGDTLWEGGTLSFVTDSPGSSPDDTVLPPGAVVNTFVSNDGQPADGAAVVQYIVSVKSASGLPLEGISVRLAFPDNTPATATPVSGVTDENGQFVSGISNILSGTISITPIVGGQTQASKSVTFASGGEAQQENVSQLYLLSMNPTTARADGEAEVPFMVIARDKDNLPLPNIPVFFKSVGTASVPLSTTALFKDPSAQTGTDGSFASSLTNTVPENVAIIAFTTTSSGATIESNVINVAFTLSSTNATGDPSSLQVTVVNNSPPADNSQAVTLHTVVRDANNIPMENIKVQYSVAATGDTVDNAKQGINPISGEGATNAQGLYSFSLKSDVAGTYPVTIWLPDFPDQAANSTSVTFIDEAAAGKPSSWEGTIFDDNQFADGVSSIRAKIIVRDENNIPLPNQRVQLSVASNTAKIYLSAPSASNTPPEENIGTTNADGFVDFFITNTTAESLPITAWALDFPNAEGQNVATINFIPPAPASENAPYDAIIEVNPSTQIADGQSEVKVNVFARTVDDPTTGIIEGGAPVENATVNILLKKQACDGTAITSSVTTAIVTNSSGTTGTNGFFETSITDILPECFVVQAQIVREGEDLANAKMITSSKINFIDPNAASTSDENKADQGTTVFVSAIPNSAQADGQQAITLTAVVSNNAGARLDNISVSFALARQDGSQALALFGEDGASGLTQNGVFSTDITSRAGETLTVTATVALKDYDANDPNTSPQAVGTATVSFNKASSLVLLTSSPQLLSGTTDTVTVTALVKDNNNNPVDKYQVNFTASSGSITPQNNGLTQNGVATAILSTQGNALNREITIRATADGIPNANPATVEVSGTALSISGPTNTTSRDAPGFLITLRDSANGSIAQHLVRIESAGNPATGEKNTLVYNGKEYPNGIIDDVRTNLSGNIEFSVLNPAFGNSNNESLTDTLTVTAEGATTDSHSYNISNDIFCVVREPYATTVRDINAPATGPGLPANDFCNPPEATTEAQRLDLAQEKPLSTDVSLNTPAFFTVYWERPGESEQQKSSKMARISTTRGFLASVPLNADRNSIPCSAATQSTLTNVGHGPLPGEIPDNLIDTNKARFMVCANNAGPATIDIEEVIIEQLTQAVAQQGPSTKFSFDFIATNPATLDLQANPVSLGVNAEGSDAEQSQIIAIVRDAENNLVKNQRVEFSLEDVSGGRLSPSFATTDSFGRAAVTYIAGSSPSAAAGVKITAKLTENNNIQDAITIAVGRRAAFVTLGFGNKLEALDTTKNAMKGTVLVNDINGNPMPNIEINLKAVPRTYSTGYYILDPDSGTKYLIVTTSECYSEDIYSEVVLGDVDANTNDNAILDYLEVTNPTTCRGTDTDGNGRIDSEDINCNQELDPGNILSIPNTLTTDENGFADFEMSYLKEYSIWVSVRVTASTLVSGSESRDEAEFSLYGLASDYTVSGGPPPRNPFGSFLRDYRSFPPRLFQPGEQVLDGMCEIYQSDGSLPDGALN